MKEKKELKNSEKKETKKKMGRPKKEIDKNLFESLCKIQCTEVEIAGVMNICEDTLNNWCKETYGTTFLEIFKKKSAGGKISLRRAQFRLAETNATMAIFLGKQYLGQTDKVEVDNSEIDKVKELMDKLKEEANK